MNRVALRPPATGPLGSRLFGTSSAGTALLAAVLLGVLGLLWGCGEGEARNDIPPKSYTVRGMVRELPGPNRQISVHHEAIDDFVSLEGEVVGMSSMTMPFPLAQSVDVEGLAIGDPVEMTLTLDWDGDPPVQITKLRELPAGTELEFREARPRAGSE